MKFYAPTVVALLFSVHTVFAADTPVKPASDQDKLSYAMGLDLGAYLKNVGEELNLEMLKQGVSDAYTGAEPLITAEEAKTVEEAFAKRQRDQQIKETVEKVKKNQAAQQEFMAANKAKDGVVQTESGLQYKMLKKGNGTKPTAEDMVEVHYRGSLLDGTEFDSSYKRNEPAKFQVKQVIPGWQEALQIMDVGSEYDLYIPSELAYGDRGVPPVIEPGSMLVFHVELLDIPKAETKDKE